MTIPAIITPMNFTLARDAICQHLANIRDEQIKLAQDSGAEDDWIKQVIDFTIYPKSFHFPDVEQMPCVYVYFNEMKFPESEQDIYENEAVGNLVVEYYTVGLNETSDTEILKTADENAEDRLNYLTAQIYKILCSEATNIYVATNRLIKGWKIKSWKRIISPEKDNTASTVLGAKFEFEVQFGEPTHYTETIEIKEYYMTLDIREEFIDPFVRLILDESS